MCVLLNIRYACGHKWHVRIETCNTFYRSGSCIVLGQCLARQVRNEYGDAYGWVELGYWCGFCQAFLVGGESLEDVVVGGEG